MWVAVVLRTPQVRRSWQRRGLWLAVLGAAVATTLDLASVTGAVERGTGAGDTVDLVRNVTGILSAVALLEIAGSLTGGRVLRRCLRAAVGAVLVSLLVIGFTQRPQGVPAPAGPSAAPSTAYWLLIVATHLAANCVCLAVCLSHGRRSAGRPLRVALLLFASGTAVAGVFWLGVLSLMLSHTWSVALQPFALALHGLLLSAALTVPTAAAAHRSFADARDCWLLWPLWRDIVEVCPQVMLFRRRSRLREALWPHGPRQLLLYRRVMEIRDAILVLHTYVTPELHTAAGQLTRSGHPDTDRPAAVLAYVLKGARAARLDGQAPQCAPVPITCLGGDNLPDETAFLVRVARIYPSVPVPPSLHLNRGK